MRVLSLMVGPIMTNCYILCDEAAKVCAVIDPGDEAGRIEEEIASSGCTPIMILLTHGHFDHCTGVAGLLEKWPELPVYIHEADVVDTVGDQLKFCRLGEKNQRYYHEGDKLTVGNLTLDVMETPGHSQGSVSLLVEGQHVIFSGDTLFRGNCGRCDFPGGDYRAMVRSLGRLGKLEGQYAVYPGHEEATDMDYERKANPYMRHGMTV